MMSGLATPDPDRGLEARATIAQNRIEQYGHDFNSELWQTESEPAVSTVAPMAFPDAAVLYLDFQCPSESRCDPFKFDALRHHDRS
jgi:hypothetical protein